MESLPATCAHPWQKCVLHLLSATVYLPITQSPCLSSLPQVPTPKSSSAKFPRLLTHPQAPISVILPMAQATRFFKKCLFPQIFTQISYNNINKSVRVKGLIHLIPPPPPNHCLQHPWIHHSTNLSTMPDVFYHWNTTHLIICLFLFAEIMIKMLTCITCRFFQITLEATFLHFI